MDLWYPAAIRNPAPTELWGTYRDDDGQWKYLLHSTESDVFRPDDDSYFGHTSYPHFTAYLKTSEKLARIYQHIPINRAARALKNKPGGIETNADRVVQIEIVGRAHQAPTWPKALLDAVRAVGLWVVEQTGMPWQSTVRFVAGGAGVRLNGPTFDNYAGILGHQHAPENDHVDPGAIDIRYILEGGTPPPEPTPTPTPEDDMGTLYRNEENGLWFLVTGGLRFELDPDGIEGDPVRAEQDRATIAELKNKNPDGSTRAHQGGDVSTRFLTSVSRPVE